MLSEYDVAEKVAITPNWKDSELLEATLQINGVDVPAEVMESFMKDIWNKACKQYSEKYNAVNIDNLVEERAQQLLKDHADDALTKIGELTDTLNGYDNLLTPHWEREESNLTKAAPDLLSALKLAKDMMIANDLDLKHTMTVIDEALAKV